MSIACQWLNADGLAFLERLEGQDAETRKRRWRIINQCAAYAQADDFAESEWLKSLTDNGKVAAEVLMVHLLLRVLMYG